MPCVRAGLLSRCPETPAWIHAQGSHHALPRSGGEPASTAFGGGRSSLGVAVSRKSIAHIRGPHPELQKLWAALCLLRIVDAIALAYQSQGEPCPMGVRAHSTRSVASSYALAHGASLADICRAAGWATPSYLRYCQAVTTNRKDLKPSFIEGWNPFRLLWGKEQRLGYLQQRCTQWSLRAPRLANLRWGDGKVATFRMAFVCHALACQHLHATRLWRGSGCGAFHRTPMSSRHNL